MTALNSTPKTGRRVSRRIYLTLIQTASRTGQYRFAHQTALSWITTFPGDLPVTYLLGEALYKDKRPDLAKPILERLCQSDPEFRAAIELLIEVEASIDKSPSVINSATKSEQKGLPTNKINNLNQWALALGSRSDRVSKGIEEAQAWGERLYQVRKSIPDNNSPLDIDALIKAELDVHQVLAINPETSLAAVTHLEILRAKVNEGIAPIEALRSLSEYYLTRFPNCLQCKLMLADALIYGGDAEKAVALLHQVAAKDVTGQVIRRLLGDEHPYRSLWQTDLEAVLDIPIPAAVASVLGWNQLPEGEPGESCQTTVESIPEQNTAVFFDAFEAVEISPQHEKNIDIKLSVEEIETIPSPLEQSKTVPSIEEPEAPKITSQLDSASSPSQQKEAENHNDDIDHDGLSEVSETLKSVKDEFEKISTRLKQPALTRVDGRYPVYVILSVKENLLEQYGEEGANQIETAMLELAKAVETTKKWKGLVFYADLGLCLPDQFSTLRFPHAKSSDPWALKLALVDLDSALKKFGMMIGAVLIVGGSDIVPFHHLPNPTEDNDEDVPSDNPYGTRDHNYFIPEWQVGRLPGGGGDNQSKCRFIIQSLKIYAERHANSAKETAAQPILSRWLKSFANLVFGGVPVWLNPQFKPQAFGYTAAAWKKASFQVFKTIGSNKKMVAISPPMESQPYQNISEVAGTNGKKPKLSIHSKFANQVQQKSRKIISIPEAAFGYYNLHGVSDATNWYGQGENSPKGPVNTQDNQNYPVALRPQDICSNGKALHQVVFSEACYGANHLHRSEADSISYRFLLAGCQAFVGSTCTSYGSIDNSLEAADLLAHGFWCGIQRGFSAGEALRRSKMAMAREIHLRQGYLGGEDQKTLISFVLYGDPLAQPVKSTQFPKSMSRSIKPPQPIKTACEHGEDCGEAIIVSAETFRYVRNLVAQYLPGMRDASLKIRKEKTVCSTSCKRCQNTQTSTIGAKAMGSSQNDNQSASQPALNRQVVILSKQISSSDHIHKQIARLTLDENGKMVKLVVSR